MKLTRALPPLGVNAIPAAGMLFGGWSPATAMAVYFLENLVGAALVALRMRVLVPPDSQRGKSVKFFAMVAGGFIAVHGVFLGMFLFHILDERPDLRAVRDGFAAMVAFQILAFVIDFFTLRPITVPQGEVLAERALGRIFFLHLAIFLGVFFAARSERLFLLPFIVLKAIVEAGSVAAPLVAPRQPAKALSASDSVS